MYFRWYQNMQMILTVASLISLQITTQLRANEPLTSVKVTVLLLVDGWGGGSFRKFASTNLKYYTDFGLNHSIKIKWEYLLYTPEDDSVVRSL